MSTRTTRRTQDSADCRKLYIAFELGHQKWLLRFGDGTRHRDVGISARDLERLTREIKLARQKFGLPDGSEVRSCYEAGWDGFWLHRYLTSQEIENVVVDSSSIEVNRRRRRAKTDRLDVAKLHSLLIRHDHGDRVWSVVAVPMVEDEDSRQPHRELERLRCEERRHRNRIEGLLVTQGLAVKLSRKKFPEQLDGLRLWDGSAVPGRLKQVLLREWERWQLVYCQRTGLEKARRKQVEKPSTPTEKIVDQLQQLRAIGETTSWILTAEFLGWRHFDNGKQVGALAGLAPTPYASGTQGREQGISKAGNARVRRIMVEISWIWLRLQPDSALSQWFRRRFALGGPRARRIGVVALARKLLVALWRWVEHGVVPEGAQLAARP